MRVVVAAIGAVVIGLLVFGPRLRALTEGGAAIQ